MYNAFKQGRVQATLWKGEVNMIYFKACPKCRGDIQLQSDNTGHALHCLQCGFERAVAPHLLAKAREMRRARAA